MSKTRYRARSKSQRSSLAQEALAVLESLYTDEPQFLNWKTPFELMIAVTLSAQTTDLQVNKVSPALFARFPDPVALAAASQEDVEDLVRTTGFFHVKARNIRAAAAYLLAAHQGQVPSTMDELVKIPGLGRKSAGVVLHHIFNKPAIIVDTHFGRVCRRLGLTAHEDPVKLEHDIAGLLDESSWGSCSMRFNRFGRDFCKARTPLCTQCSLASICPSFADFSFKPPQELP